MADRLRSTPRGRWGHDAAVFPEAHAAYLRQRAPRVYSLKVFPRRVRITHDFFVLPPEMAERLRALYAQYVHWWATEHRRDFPRGGLGYGGFRDSCAVVVLREHAPWWIQLFREAARFCINPFETDLRGALAARTTADNLLRALDALEAEEEQ
jgi:hypothetical protein